MTVTAYCACRKCCGPWAAYRRFSDGGDVDAATAAVAAPASIPLGARVAVPGYAGGSWVAVRDRGGAIVEGRLDVYYGDHDRARAWGRRRLLVAIDATAGDGHGLGTVSSASN
jgi:3D (Asp-Asp-Asp) domain-containing protein